MSPRARSKIRGIVTVDRAEGMVSLCVIDMRTRRAKAATIHMEPSEARKVSKTLARFAAVRS